MDENELKWVEINGNELKWMEMSGMVEICCCPIHFYPFLSIYSYESNHSLNPDILCLLMIIFSGAGM